MTDWYLLLIRGLLVVLAIVGSLAVGLLVLFIKRALRNQTDLYKRVDDYEAATNDRMFRIERAIVKAQPEMTSMLWPKK